MGRSRIGTFNGRRDHWRITLSPRVTRVSSRLVLTPYHPLLRGNPAASNHWAIPPGKGIKNPVNPVASAEEEEGNPEEAAAAAAMASLATASAAVQPVTVKGLGGSSLHGTRLALKPPRRSLPRTHLRQDGAAWWCRFPTRHTSLTQLGSSPPSHRSGSGGVVAKYGEKSVYFDLDDIANTTGQWDLYGSDAPSPYNPLQSKFFETFAAPFTKRGLLLKFLILGGTLAIGYLGSTVSGDVLPIKKGPQLPPKLGPRDKI
uniref:Photosystem I reaction center subunit VI n=1 Tax=Anthurium amnicola TaxID=1678845 RepID=A0A1D1YXB1_9ARAE